MSETSATAVMWFRNDLRTHDNAALFAACRHKNIIPIYILDEHTGRALGLAKKWWLHHALNKLNENIERLGGKLILRKGDEANILKQLIKKTNAGSIYWNRRYEPDCIKRDIALKSNFVNEGIDVKSFSGHLLHEPTQLQTRSGTPFRVFTPFWKALDIEVTDALPIPQPDTLPQQNHDIESDKLTEWNLCPANPNWASGFAEFATPGENAAQKTLQRFLAGQISDYKESRDFPATSGTSSLSPYLTFGEISPRQIWCESLTKDGGQAFRRQLGWRDFSYHLLFHNPNLSDANFNSKFDNFGWSDNSDGLECWKKGLTGYPIVDAGMRELWQTGYMHNRVRMIVASFLTKHLLIDWRIGEQWFWDTLLDADPANNAASWQWVAGSGADASPYYRIFNPIIQGKKFDSDGIYVRRHLPELRNLNNKFIHTPWEASDAELESASITLGKDYPHPIVEHSLARNRALSAYQRMKEAA